MWTLPGKPWLSILDAVFTVSPNKQYLGIFWPTTPATTGPVWMPTRIYNGNTNIIQDEKAVSGEGFISS